MVVVVHTSTVSETRATGAQGAVNCIFDFLIDISRVSGRFSHPALPLAACGRYGFSGSNASFGGAGTNITTSSDDL